MVLLMANLEFDGIDTCEKTFFYGEKKYVVQRMVQLERIKR